MTTVFQIVFEMTSFFILIFADHVIIHPYTQVFTTLSAYVDFMAPMIVGLVLIPPRCIKQPNG